MCFICLDNYNFDIAHFDALLHLQFYFQNGRPPPKELKERCLFRINQFFYGHNDGLQMNGDKL